MSDTQHSASRTERMTRTFEHVVQRFEEAWAAHPLPKLKDFLSEELPAEQRSRALLELVLIDLENRWKHFGKPDAVGASAHSLDAASVNGLPKCPLLEDYCERFPELGPCHQLPLEAVEHEFRMRLRAGVVTDPQEYVERFPRLETELTRLICEPNVVETANKQEKTLAERKSQSGDLSLESPVSLASLRFPVPDLDAGQMFGRYRVDRVLGQGGMGTVYEVYDTHLHRVVALKIPFFRRGHSSDAVNRFLREARAAAKLSHPNLCRIFDVGVIDGVLFLTMQFVEGQSLEAILKRSGALPRDQIAILVRQIALALQDAHDHGIIHRDLKPANILLDAKQQPILMDFGLARSFEGEEAELTREGDLLGTPGYMSPEQVQGETNELGPATDIYSLGVTMYRLLTNRLPFEGRMTAVLSAIPKQVPPAPREFNSQITPLMEAICLRAIAKRPSERFASAAKFAEALEPLVHDVASNSAMPEKQIAPTLKTGHESSEAVRQGGSRLKMLVSLFTVASLVLVAVGFDRGVRGNISSNPVLPRHSSSSSLPAKPRLTTHSAVADAKLEIHLQRAEQQTGYSLLSNQSLPLKANDKLQLHVNLTDSAFVYVFWIDTDGLCKVFWPVDGDLDDPKSWSLLEPERQEPVREVWLPALAEDKNDKQKMFTLDKSIGLETILVATSPQPLGHVELEFIDSLRVDLAYLMPSQRELMAFHSSSWTGTQTAYATLLPPSDRRRLVPNLEDQPRGVAGVVETFKTASLPIDEYTKRLGDVFATYTGLVFPHE